MNIFQPDRAELLEKWADMIRVCAPISQWTTDAEIAWLAEAASQLDEQEIIPHPFRPMAGEIGSYKGKSAKAMSWNTRAEMICIDRFQDDTRAECEKNLADEIQSGKVRIIPLESGEAFLKFPPHCQIFDLFFIDGSHEKHDVIRDIGLWRPLVRPGGILCGHDCWPNDPQNGIFHALKELRLDFTLVIDSIWAVRV